VLPSAIVAADTATPLVDNVIYPVGTWQIATHHGEDLGGLYHMGVDVGADGGSGAPVYAIANGIVREAQQRSQFGLVVLIEHFTAAGSSYVSLYGHLDPTVVVVVPGQIVATGDTIGQLGTAENNGGWTPHLHFGIHKSAYTGDWVYYGHVHDSATADEWYDPETFISEHLAADSWQPTVTTNIVEGDIVGDTATFTVGLGDIGSTVKTLRYRARAVGEINWTTLEQTATPLDNTTVTLPLYGYPDGAVEIKLVARDYFNNKTELVIAVLKDPYRSSLSAFVAMKGSKSDGFVTQWSYAGTALQAFFPFQTDWSQGGDLAVGDVLGADDDQLVMAKGTPQHITQVKVLAASGQLLERFSPFSLGTPRVATADTAADGTSEIIVGSGKRQVATVKAFTASGAQLWSFAPFGEFARHGLDVAAANLDGTAGDEVVACTRSGDVTACAVVTGDGSIVLDQFYPFKKSFTGGVNVTAGDVTGDGSADIIVGTESGGAGRVRVVDSAGKKLLPGLLPFGDTFSGSVDVSTTQWDTTEDNVTEMEVVVSQASLGQAWIKVYRLSGAEAEIVFEKRIYETDFTGGARIAGYL
jgi:hypothetical protein